MLEGLKDTKIISSEVKYIPNEYVELNGADQVRLNSFFDMCDADDDIQWVVPNSAI